MLRRVDCASWSRFLAPAVMLGLLGACSAPLERALGSVEVLVPGACDGASAGQLRLEGTSTVVVPGRELCLGSVVRELPAGLYRLSWQGSADDGMAATAPAQPQSPALLSVLAGRSTLLRVTLETAAASPALDSALSEYDDHAPSATACSYSASRAGPS